MAPPPEQASDNIQESYDDFIAKLESFHANRGTVFEAEPKVGSRQVNLQELFNKVVDRGGYDAVSDEKLAWRKLGHEFGLGSNNLPALAFQLKTTYYRYLAAFEIKTIHKKEPPPRDILEDVTAKGGSLLTRTRESYRASTRRDREASTGDSGEEGTPVRERNESEDAPGSGGRATRNLRHAPTPRALFQPDTGSSRGQSRPSNSTSSPMVGPSSQAPRGASSYHNPSSNSDNMSPALANYEPRTQVPITLRPVVTPANNPTEFAKRQRLLQEAAAASKSTGTQAQQPVMLPGTGYQGQSIYTRCLLGLKSGIPAEQEYALHHLTKISMERGDKFRFETFPGLADALIEKMLEVSSLFYNVEWEISYLDNGRMPSTHSLDGIYGTKDIIDRILNLTRKGVDDNIQTEEFSNQMLLVNEAALTFRNMVMLEENAHFASEIFPLRDFISIALLLPTLDSVVELKHNALEIAEQLTKYVQLDETDPLYTTLLREVGRSEDRGSILTSLRAISRISLNLEESNRLRGFPSATVQRIIDWTMLDDEELVHASLDFLYQYTAVVENVDFMITEFSLFPFVNQLTRLLMHGSKMVVEEIIIKPEIRRPGPETVPDVPSELMNQLLKLEEPARSTQWLRCLFEEDKDESITQIALWQAYRNRFSPFDTPGRQILSAADFIKNVSTTFQDKATAQVQAGPTQKFIIKGIRIRERPVDFYGKEYAACQWNVSTVDANNKPIVKECREYFTTTQQMYRHLLIDHSGLKKSTTEDKYKGNYHPFERQSTGCCWGDCSAAPIPTMMWPSSWSKHVTIHIEKVLKKLAAQESSGDEKKTPSWITPAITKSWVWHETAVDERGDAAGIPLSAILVLRNLARNIHKTEAEELALKEPDGISHVLALFLPIKQQMIYQLTYHKCIGTYVSDVILAIK